jgi:hypothetical protein
MIRALFDCYLIMLDDDSLFPEFGLLFAVRRLERCEGADFLPSASWTAFCMGVNRNSFVAGLLLLEEGPLATTSMSRLGTTLLNFWPTTFSKPLLTVPAPRH